MGGFPGADGVHDRQVLKETASSVDFSHTESPKDEDWYAAGRKVDLVGGNVTRVPGSATYTVAANTARSSYKALPLPGSRELEQKVKHTEERNPLGCIFEMLGITFGLEVCLDHLNARLINAPDKSGVQIQLIPSWGMRIYTECSVPNAIVFNVDGHPRPVSGPYFYEHHSQVADLTKWDDVWGFRCTGYTIGKTECFGSGTYSLCFFCPLPIPKC
jgi:hypothetical protein